MTNVSLKSWMMAFRPKTLAASIAPVLIGTSMAFGDGIHHFGYAMICFLTALSVQIGTNLANDYYDFKKGADTEERIGPTRVTQSGLISPQSVFISFIIAFLITAICCYALFLRGGWPIAIIGILSIISGYLYTGGPKPLGYMGLGDVFVLIFFGPVAVGGTYYVQSLEINAAVILSGFAPGLISVAILAINNLRDVDSDAKTGKKTLAVRFGKTFAQYEYIISVLIACLIPIIIFMLTSDHNLILILPFLIFCFLPSIKIVLTYQDGRILNPVLGNTGKLLLLYSILFSIGWIYDHNFLRYLQI